MFKKYIENNIVTKQMAYIKNLKDWSNVNFNKNIDRKPGKLKPIKF